MSTIRKQTIISSVLVYIGFGLGAISMLYFTKKGYFTEQQFGLATIFYSFSQMALVFSLFGLNAVIYKFYPYYKDNLPKKQIDLLSWSLLLVIFGFLIVCGVGYFIQPFIIEIYTAKSKLLVDFYPLLFPFAFGALIFTLFEAYSLSLRKSIAPSFLRETMFKFLNLIIVLLYCFKQISFTTFMYLFMSLNLITASLLIAYIYFIGELHFSFKVSRVTKKFWKKMLKMQSLIYFGTLVIAIGATIDAFVISKIFDLGVVGYFTVAQYGSSLIQVPTRTIQNVSVGVLSQAWKDKNYAEIQRVYSRSSINLLLLSTFLFGNIWLNVLPLFNFFDIQSGYQTALSTLFVFGIARSIDGAFGVNNMIIGTSTFWRFDFISSIILLALRLPLAWILIKEYGIIGSAIAEIIAVTSYNLVRFIFLKVKFNFQPFSYKTLLSVLVAVLSYFIAFYSCTMFDGLIGMILRATIFSCLMIAGIFAFKLTPDALQMYERWVKKVK
jgi:O-antigen/teichoic acid export membrane protein